MEAKPRNVEIYTAKNGERPFEIFVGRIDDRNARAAIYLRIDRIRRGAFGDWKAIREGVCEMRIHYGPGFRIYCGLDGDSVILLCGGTKNRQKRDISAAIRYWRDYNA